jgi:hypothetical protein
MPVILTTAEEIDLWLEGETIEALICKGHCRMTR